MLSRIHHDSNMPVPTVLREGHQISGLRIVDPAKLTHSAIKLSCGSVVVRESSFPVHHMYHMRTIVSIEPGSYLQGSCDDSEPIGAPQQVGGSRMVLILSMHNSVCRRLC